MKNVAYTSFVMVGLSLLAPSFGWAASKCGTDLLNVAELAAKYDYPKNIDPEKMPKGYYMYGLESEYALDAMSYKLLTYYAPAEDLLERAVWENMPPENRAAWVKKNWDRVFPDGPKKPSHLVRVAPDADLPDYLVADETGNVELVTKPFDTWTQMQSFMGTLKANIGPGYLQASISVPAKPIFKSDKSTLGFAGYRLVIGSYDEISKLADGYVKNQQIPGYIPGKALTHPFLGPMNANRANFLRRVVQQNRYGSFDSDVMYRISSRNASYKYTSEVAYRPDVLKDDSRFVNEIRDCVKGFDCLEDRLNRERYFLGQDLSVFAKFANVRPLDLIADFDLLPQDVQSFLQEVFPGPDMDVEAIRNDLASENLVAEKFRSFAYPMQDWASWIGPMGISTHSPEYMVIKTAQHDYVMSVKEIAAEYAAKTVDAKKAGDLVQLAVAKFSYESGLVQIYDSWFHLNFADGAEGAKPIWK